MKIDLHIHSCYSVNLASTKIFGPPSIAHPKEILRIASRRGIGGLAITDHDNLEGSLIAHKISKKFGVIVVKGVEVTSQDGHIIALNVQENIKPKISAEETIDLIDEQGGVAIAAHPFNRVLSLSRKKILALKERLFALEIYNGRSWPDNRVDTFSDKYNFAKSCGSDAHHIKEIGNAYLSTNESINSDEDIMKAIKKGRVIPHQIKHASIIRDIAPTCLQAFFYWKYKQFCKIFDHSIKMPHDEK